MRSLFLCVLFALVIARASATCLLTPTAIPECTSAEVYGLGIALLAGNTGANVYNQLSMKTTCTIDGSAITQIFYSNRNCTKTSIIRVDVMPIETNCACPSLTVLPVTERYTPLVNMTNVRVMRTKYPNTNLCANQPNFWITKSYFPDKECTAGQNVSTIEKYTCGINSLTKTVVMKTILPTMDCNSTIQTTTEINQDTCTTDSFAYKCVLVGQSDDMYEMGSSSTVKVGVWAMIAMLASLASHLY